MIQINNIAFAYRKKHPLFVDFTLNLEKGKIYGLLGQNGAGKSTLLHLLSGLLIPKKGHVFFDGKEVGKRAPSVLNELFLVPEEFELPGITLEKYVKINSPFYPRFSAEQMRQYLDCFEMSADVHLGQLSMGQKKKVFMSFALATNTSLLLMDEPTNGLDIPAKSQFRKFMAMGMSDEKTFLISTHQVQDVDKMLDHIIIMNQSDILLDQPVSKIIERLSFIHTDGKPDPTDVLYTLPTVSGHSVLKRNISGEDSSLNLELLYNGILHERAVIASLFNDQKN